MPYVVEPLLAETRHQLLSRLAAGELNRFGGVLRVARGYPGAGQIAGHLRDVGQGVQALSPVLSGVLQMTQVAAAASVVGVGVSVVGFAVVTHKLNKLQASVSELSAVASRNHGEVLSALDRVGSQLVELRYIALESRDLLRASLDEIRRVRTDLLDSYLAAVLTEVDLLRRTEHLDESRVQQALRVFGTARRWLQSTLAAHLPSADGDALWLDRLVRYRVLCLTWAAEIQLLRRVGDDQTAAQFARECASQSRVWARAWCDTLLPRREFEGPFRFAHSAFSDMDREVFSRVVRMQDGTVLTHADPRELQGRLAVSRELPALAPDWVSRQYACAGLLDFVEETTARLESLADELEMCAEHRLGFDDWERLSAVDGQHALELVCEEG